MLALSAPFFFKLTHYRQVRQLDTGRHRAYRRGVRARSALVDAPLRALRVVPRDALPPPPGVLPRVLDTWKRIVAYLRQGLTAAPLRSRLGQHQRVLDRGEGNP